MDFHDTHFCNTSLPSFNYSRTDEYSNFTIATELICTNKSKWLSEQVSSFYDPHNCKDSCSNPGQGLSCLACSNPNYFTCFKTNDICLHPDLECDGHPQCPGGEDEDRDICYKINHRGKFIQPVHKCNSTLYEDLPIYARRCDYVKECSDGSDENNCKDELSNTILISLCLIMMCIYIILKVYRRKCKKIFKLREKSVESLDMGILTTKFKDNPNDQEMIEQVQILLFNIIFAQSLKKRKKILIKTFDITSKKFDGNDAEIYYYLKANFDPVIIQESINAKFPGILEKCKEYEITYYYEEGSKDPYTETFNTNCDIAFEEVNKT